MLRRFPFSVPAARIFYLVGALAIAALSQQRAAAAAPDGGCPRPLPSIEVPEPVNLRSHDGELHVDLTVRNSRQSDGSVRYCYLLPDGRQSPTLRAKPGDLVVITLHNELTDLETPDDEFAPHMHMHMHMHAVTGADEDPCTSAAMTATSANLHFTA
ncbi:MAG: hypothetical protein WDM77_16135 [Steroidobacteraceae bacterium]